ncbi:MAG: ArnT family glycosyltransferase [Sumerlaeia bacterium]
MSEKQATKAFFAFLLLSVCFRLLYTAFGPLDLVEDEAYYWEWSRQLDWSYYSKGPMVAYLIALFTRTLGVSELGLRLPSILMGAGTLYTIFLLASSLCGSRVTGLLAAIILSCSPIFIAGSMLLTIDSPLFFFYTLACYFSWQACNGNRLRDWVFAGIALGLGIMAKAAILFFVPSLLLFLAFSPKHRGLLKQKGPWVCIGVGMLFFAPQLIWNAQNDWVMFKDFLFKGGAGREIPWSERNPFLFIGSQAGVLSPYIFWLVLAGIWHSWAKRKADEAPAAASKHLAGLSPEAARFLLAFTFPILGFFFLLSFNVPINANWPIIGYLSGAIAGAAYLHSRLRTLILQGNRGALSRFRTIATAGLMLGAVPSYGLFVTDVFHQVKLPNNGAIDPTNRLAEWVQFAEKVAAIREVYAAEGELFLSSKYYQETALMAFYLKDHPTTYCFEHRARKNQYYFLNDFTKVVGQNSLFIARRDKDLRHVERAFDSVQPVTKLTIMRGKNAILEYDVYFCRNFHGWTYKEPQIGDE